MLSALLPLCLTPTHPNTTISPSPEVTASEKQSCQPLTALIPNPSKSTGHSQCPHSATNISSNVSCWYFLDLGGWEQTCWSTKHGQLQRHGLQRQVTSIWLTRDIFTLAWDARQTEPGRALVAEGIDSSPRLAPSLARSGLHPQNVNHSHVFAYR